MSRRPELSRRVQALCCLSVQSGGSLTPDDWTDSLEQMTASAR